MDKQLRILIADDHEIVRRGIRALIENQPNWVVADEAVSGRQALDLARSLTPDVVIMDISMPEMNGLEATRRIREEGIDTEVLILSVHDSEQVIREVLDAGATGYVLKSDAGRDLVAAIEKLCQHKHFYTAKVNEMMLEEFLRTGSSVEEIKAPSCPLTTREREVLQLLAEGNTNKEVGVKLGISIKTVETHRAHIMSKLNLHSMSDLVRYAIRNQFIQP